MVGRERVEEENKMCEDSRARKVRGTVASNLGSQRTPECEDNCGRYPVDRCDEHLVLKVRLDAVLDIAQRGARVNVARRLGVTECRVQYVRERIVRTRGEEEDEEEHRRPERPGEGGEVVRHETKDGGLEVVPVRVTKTSYVRGKGWRGEKESHKM